MLKNLKIVFAALVLLCGGQTLFAQKDTEFWFVAPEVAQGANNYDRPVAFRFSTYDAAATVTVSQPANPLFPVQTLNIPANTSGALEFPPLFDFVENTPPNTVLNKGFLIQSTAPITVYYEVKSQFATNPEIFVLKGKNALGKQFYIPMQNIADNSSAYLPLPHAAFDIVATEDNTSVTITVTKAVVGHPINSTFSVLLNKGQTYSAEATSQASSAHPVGSHVVSDKPIAITMKDDLLEGGMLFGGFCRDLIGDQIVPVDRLGTRYVVQKGYLNDTEFAFVIGTVDGTNINFDGAPAGTVNAGGRLLLDISDVHFIESSEPVYVLQLTGSGACELSGVLLPGLDCSGSKSVRFVRSVEENFYLFLVTRSGNEGAFTLNGNSSLIQASDFQPVPGSGNEFVAARIPFTETQVPTNVSSIVENSLGVFQMGFMNGGFNTGSRFGFFSDFGHNASIFQNVQLCSGDTVHLYGLTITGPGNFTATHSDPVTGCDTFIRVTALLSPPIQIAKSVTLCPNDTVVIGGVSYSQPGIVKDTVPGINSCDTIFTYTIIRKDSPTVEQTVSFCPGSSVTLNGTVYTQPGTVSFSVPSPTGCDSILVYHLELTQQPTKTKTVTFCPGSSVTINGVTYSAPTTLMQTIPATSGCDTLLTLNLVYAPQPTVTRTIKFCPGKSVTIGSTTYTQPGTVQATLPATTGCDTIATFHLEFAAQPTVTRTIKFCPGKSVTIGGITYTQPGTVQATLPATTGCDTIATFLLQYAPQPTKQQTITFCKGSSVTLYGTVYTQPGTYTIIIPASSGCDTVATYTLQYTHANSTIQLNCPYDIFVDADPGATAANVSYTQPTATTDCPCPGLNLALQQGLPSGSSFALGVTDVCYRAKDSCGSQIICCFKVHVQETEACDTKVIGCIKYELLSITVDAQQRKTYRIRLTNNCANKLSYLAIQQPAGIIADLPPNNTSFTAPSGHKYAVRNPNYSPFYSIRYSTVLDSIHNGGSDVFKYTLPPQADPDYIHVTVRLEPQVYYEAHLNVFNCPIEYEPNNRPATGERGVTTDNFKVFPNPTDGLLYADLSAWEGQDLHLRILNTQGQTVQQLQVSAEASPQEIILPDHLANGLYFIELWKFNDKKQVRRFVIQH